MEQGGRHISLHRLRGRVAGLKNRLMRARYFRGHGVHSPFVYSIVRNVFMRRELLGSDTTLLGELCAAGVASHRALELQNLMNHCGLNGFSIYGRNSCPLAVRQNAELCVLLRDAGEALAARLLADAAAYGAVVAVMDPYADPARERMCRAMVAAHASTTVDNRGYLLLFNDKNLPKQHFRI